MRRWLRRQFLRFVCWLLGKLDLRVVWRKDLEGAYTASVTLLRFTHRSGYLANPKLPKKTYRAVEKTRGHAIAVGYHLANAERIL